MMELFYGGHLGGSGDLNLFFQSYYSPKQALLIGRLTRFNHSNKTK